MRTLALTGLRLAGQHVALTATEPYANPLHPQVGSGTCPAALVVPQPWLPGPCMGMVQAPARSHRWRELRLPVGATSLVHHPGCWGFVAGVEWSRCNRCCAR